MEVKPLTVTATWDEKVTCLLTPFLNSISYRGRFLRFPVSCVKAFFLEGRAAMKAGTSSASALAEDVTALKILSSDLRMELQHELCHPYVMRNSVASHQCASLKLLIAICR